MDLSSPWDRSRSLIALWFMVAAMTGCQALFSGGNSTPAGSVSAGSTRLDFGAAAVGSSKQLTDKLTNHSAAMVMIASAVSSDPAFQVTEPVMPFSLAPGQSISLTIAFAPQTAGKPAGKIAVKSNASGSPEIDVTVSGSAVASGNLSVSPVSLPFGAVQVGQSQSKSATLTNPGGTSVTVSQISVSCAAFTVGALTRPVTLAAGQSLTFNATFAPQTSGAVSGSLSLVADGSVPTLNVPLSGTGTSPGQLAVTPARSNFGNVTVGVKQSQNGTLRASGASVTVLSVASSNPEFVITGLPLPVTLAVGQSAPFTLAFTPQASGAASATVTFSSNASNLAVAESVTGSGVAAPQHSVALSWNASTSTVVGYNLYRGAQAGGPYVAMNTATDASTTYTDNSVRSGQTYYYVVTAVDGSGHESVYSNQVQAVVPTP